MASKIFMIKLAIYKKIYYPSLTKRKSNKLGHWLISLANQGKYQLNYRPVLIVIRLTTRFRKIEKRTTSKLLLKNINDLQPDNDNHKYLQFKRILYIYTNIQQELK